MDEGTARTSPPLLWSREVDFLPPHRGANSPESILRGEFEFLNQRESIGWIPNWDAPSRSLLWTFNLHYFDWLWALEYEEAKRCVEDWICDCGNTFAGNQWEPYPTSLRLMNWLTIFNSRFRSEIDSDPEFSDRLWRSAIGHAGHISKNLEYRLMGNHLFENAAALTLFGSCYEGEEARRFYKLGLSILEKQIAEQILPDGFHFERSPMYQQRIIYVLLLLAATEDGSLTALVRDPLTKMLAALRSVCHGDGEIALLNDAAVGVYPSVETLAAEAERLRICEGPDEPASGPWSLPEAGYYGHRSSDGTYLICDAGPIGPDYLPGHAHGDIFSFEFSLRGDRIIVDSGVHGYEDDDRRAYDRSTRAHNTVEIAGEDQCEFWKAFRVARRGKPYDVKWTPALEGFALEGSHDGYHRLPGSPAHHRRFDWREGSELEVTDRVHSKTCVPLVSRLHIHPECGVEAVDSCHAIIHSPAGVLNVYFEGPGSLQLEDSTYAPQFGVIQQNVALAYSCEGTDVAFRFRIEWS